MLTDHLSDFDVVDLFTSLDLLRRKLSLLTNSKLTVEHYPEEIKSLVSFANGFSPEKL